MDASQWGREYCLTKGFRKHENGQSVLYFGPNKKQHDFWRLKHHRPGNSSNNYTQLNPLYSFPFLQTTFTNNLCPFDFKDCVTKNCKFVVDRSVQLLRCGCSREICLRIKSVSVNGLCTGKTHYPYPFKMHTDQRAFSSLELKI